MVTAAIKINGVIGSSDSLSLSTSVNLSNSNDTGVSSWSWQFVSKPPGSSATILTPSSSTASFTPDIVGSYLIKLTVIGGSSSATDEVIGAVLTPNLSMRIPAAREESEFDATQGWAEAIHTAMIAIDASSGSTHGIGSSTHTSSTLAQVNTKISDATLDDSSSSRPPTTHGLSSAYHSTTTLNNLNLKISDATLDDSSSSRPPSGSASGDLSGTYPSPDVVKIRGQNVSSSVPNASDVLVFTGGSWTPTAISLTKNTLDGAYDEGGAGAGRSINADSGSVFIDASGDKALELDGYISLKEISDPNSEANSGFVYVKDDSGDTELFYMDDSGNVVQITKDGSVVSNTLDQAYDEGGAGSGRSITADSGSVRIIVGANNHGLEVDSTGGYSSNAIYVNSNSGANNVEGVLVELDSDGYDNSRSIQAVINAGALSSGQKAISISSIIDGRFASSGTEIIAFRGEESGASSSLQYGTKLIGSNWDFALHAESGNIHLNDGYIALKEITDPDAIDNGGILYTKDDSGDTELYYRDSDGNVVKITEDGVVNASGAGNKLGQAYNQGGAGAGRIIDAYDGPVYFRYDGYEVARIKGVMGLDAQTLVPIQRSNSGFLYSAFVDGYVELLYRDNYGTLTQITSDGYLNTFESLRGVGLYARNYDPSLNSGKGYIYTKQVDGYVELFYNDGYSGHFALTDRGNPFGSSRNVERSEELNSTGSETYIALSGTPVVSAGTDSGYSIDVFQDGIRMKYVDSLGVDTTEWTYNSTLNRVEFVASGTNNWYLVRYNILSGGTQGVGNLQQAYDGGNDITISGNPLELDAYGEQAINIDGYIGLKNISDPSYILDTGLLYAKNVGGYSELHYMDDYGTIIQITSDGFLNHEELPTLAPKFLLDSYASNFVELNDVPSSYSGEGNKFLRVNSEETGLEFTSASVGSDGYNVKVSSNDTTPDFLENKIVAGSNVTISVSNPGGDEFLEISSSGGGGSDLIDGYLPLIEQESDPTALDNYGILYTKDVGGTTALFYMNESGTLSRLDGYDGGGGAGNTLDQAYDEGGAGAGRSITADSGPVAIDASGDMTLDLDGYISMDEISDPTNITNKGFVYVKNDDAYSTSELFYMDDSGQITQITQDGYLATYNSLKGIRLLEGVELPQQAGSFSIYAKDSNGVTELFGRDSDNNELQMTIQGRLGNGAVAAPGVAISIFLDSPSTTRTKGDATFSDIDAVFEVQANVPVAGKYMLQLKIGGLNATSGNEARFRVLVDGDAVTTDDKRWEISLPGAARESAFCQELVELSAGSHTFKLQWARPSGSGNVTADTVVHFELGAVLVSGSGAGGILVNTSTLSAGFSASIASTWEHVDNGGGDELTATIDVFENEQVLIIFQGRVTRGGANSFFQLRVTDNGTAIDTPATGHSQDLTNTNMSFSRVSGPLTAGSHSFKLELNHQRTDGEVVAGAVFQVIRFRGGLVPIQDDGVNILDKPQAFNFVGTGVSVTDNNGIADIQIGEIDYFRLEQQLSDPSVDPDGYDGYVYGKLVDGYSELHYMDNYGLVTQITDKGNPVGGGGNTLDQAYDEGGAGAGRSITADSGAVQIDASGDMALDLDGYVALTEISDPSPLANYGMLYTKDIGGTTALFYMDDGGGVSRLDGYDVFVDGSLATTSTKSSQQLIPSASWTEISGLTVTFNATSNEYVLVILNLNVFKTSSAGTPRFAYRLDDGTRVDLALDYQDNNLWINCSLSFVVQISSEGSHHIDFDAFVDSSGTMTISATAGNINSYATVLRFRGGLIPIQEDGYNIINKPQAFNFIGPNVRVTDNNGTADIETIPDGYLLLEEQESDPEALDSYGILYTKDDYGYTELFYMDNYGNVTQVTDDGYLAVSEITLDTKSPKGEWKTTSTVDFYARHEQLSSIVRLTLQDGKQRYFNGTLNWDSYNNVADLGWDESASQTGTDKWIYFYAVPSSTNDDLLTIRASDNNPTTGPTGYTNFKLVWTCYEETNSLIQTIQTGNRFFYSGDFRCSWSGFNVSAYTTTTLDLSSTVPYTASVVDLQLKVDLSANGQAWQLWISPISSLKYYLHVQTYLAGGTSNTNMNSGPVPIITPQTLYRTFDLVAGSGTSSYVEIAVLGWTDEWIDS